MKGSKILWLAGLILAFVSACSTSGGDDDTGDDDAGDDDTGGDDVLSEIKWVPIPAGSFEMGCSLGDGECEDNEEPRHTVSISAFEMTEIEITRDQYEAITGENPSDDNYLGYWPIDDVSWTDAAYFCEQIGGRLPTEAEWEYAARASTVTKYYCGDDWQCLDEIAWYEDNSHGQTYSGARKTPNTWGLYDMLGNVWEWTADHYGANYYDSSPASDPQGPTSGKFRVMRGGCYRNTADYLRVSYRKKGSTAGIRCARE